MFDEKDIAAKLESYREQTQQIRDEHGTNQLKAHIMFLMRRLAVVELQYEKLKRERSQPSSNYDKPTRAFGFPG